MLESVFYSLKSGEEKVWELFLFDPMMSSYAMCSLSTHYFVNCKNCHKNILCISITRVADQIIVSSPKEYVIYTNLENTWVNCRANPCVRCGVMLCVHVGFLLFHSTLYYGKRTDIDTDYIKINLETGVISWDSLNLLYNISNFTIWYTLSSHISL